MKIRVPLFLLSLLLVSLPLMAQSASGRFVIKDEAGAQTIEFDASGGVTTAASGYMTFSGPVTVNDQDGDGEIRGTDKPTIVSLTMKVAVDCLVVSRNRASLSGVVRDATVASYVGQHALLTVEDSTDLRVADRYNWGVSRYANMTWVPADAELDKDDGAYLRWTATDAERTDDKGISSEPRPYDCQSVTLWSYEDDDLFYVADGGVTVK